MTITTRFAPDEKKVRVATETNIETEISIETETNIEIEISIETGIRITVVAEIGDQIEEAVNQWSVRSRSMRDRLALL